MGISVGTDAKGVCYLGTRYLSIYTRGGGLLTACCLPQASDRERNTLFHFTSLHCTLQYTSSPHLAIQQSKLQNRHPPCPIVEVGSCCCFVSDRPE